MRAVVCTRGELSVTDLPSPDPGPGQLLLDVQRCGICGSDLHARHHGDELRDVMASIGYDSYLRSEQEIVFGHEFVGTIAAHGPDTRRTLPVGTMAAALPLVRRGGVINGVGLSALAPGGYAEQVVVQESLTLPVPNGLPVEVAALTEPLAVAWHALARGDVAKKDVAVVIGCGPVGLAIICLLSARGVRTIIASDPSAGRRAMATAAGAHVVIDPTVDSPFASAPEHGHTTTLPGAVGAAMDAIEGIARLPLPWWHVWRVLDKVGATTPKAPVVFECVGVPGMIDSILGGAPLYSRIVVVGVCMGLDAFRPALAVNKEVDLRCVVGYTPLEFRDSLHALAEGQVDVSPLLTGVVGLDGVPGAFTALEHPTQHAKIIIDPRQSADTITPVPLSRRRAR